MWLGRKFIHHYDAEKVVPAKLYSVRFSIFCNLILMEKNSRLLIFFYLTLIYTLSLYFFFRVLDLIQGLLQVGNQ